MITDDMLLPVGRILKPHSYKGELKAALRFGKELFADPKTPFFVKIDNIPVPFFVSNVSGKAENVSFLKFKDIDSDSQASMLAKKELYALKSFLSEEFGITEEDLMEEGDELIGFSVVDADTDKRLGVVEDIEEGVEYDYLAVRINEDGATISIPLLDEFIKEIEEDEEGLNGSVYVSLPDGFLEI